MKNKLFTAIATVRNAEREWDVVVYSSYKTVEEAEDGIRRFKRNYDGTEIEVVKTEIK